MSAAKWATTAERAVHGEWVLVVEHYLGQGWRWQVHSTNRFGFVQVGSERTRSAARLAAQRWWKRWSREVTASEMARRAVAP